MICGPYIKAFISNAVFAKLIEPIVHIIINASQSEIGGRDLPQLLHSVQNAPPSYTLSFSLRVQCHTLLCYAIMFYWTSYHQVKLQGTENKKMNWSGTEESL